MTNADPEIIVVGGGPVGLYLGCLLLQSGVACKVLEQRLASSEHTRSIGIHPPALERLAEVGVADALIANGIPVREGLAFAQTRHLGTLSFEACPPPYQFVLAVPQFVTEILLEEQLHELDPTALLRGVTVTDIVEDAECVQIHAETTAGSHRFDARFVIGCDGKDSVVRKAMSIAFPGESYKDTFLMGDFDDSTKLGPRAGIFLTDEGVVESFPLPGNTRRWVVKTAELMPDAGAHELADIVRHRTNHDAAPDTNTMISAFTASHYMAAVMAKGRVLLAGDAAHVVSPIGGQGMNLGWLDAWAAFAVLRQAVTDRGRFDVLFRIYSRSRRRAATVARRRAEFNMWMGRATPFQSVKYQTVRLALHTASRSYFAKRFTMRGM